MRHSGGGFIENARNRCYPALHDRSVPKGAGTRSGVNA